MNIAYKVSLQGNGEHSLISSNKQQWQHKVTACMHVLYGSIIVAVGNVRDASRVLRSTFIHGVFNRVLKLLSVEIGFKSVFGRVRVSWPACASFDFLLSVRASESTVLSILIQNKDTAADRSMNSLQSIRSDPPANKDR